MAQTAKCLPAIQETQVWSQGWENPLKNKMATHSSTLAWKIPWTEEPGRCSTWGCKESNMTDFTFTFKTTWIKTLNIHVLKVPISNLKYCRLLDFWFFKKNICKVPILAWPTRSMWNGGELGIIWAALMSISVPYASALTLTALYLFSLKHVGSEALRQ